MKETYNKMGSIRGTRYAIQLEKRVKGMPGFAPEYTDREVCEVVFKFPHDAEKPYVQFAENPPILELEDIEHIERLLKSEFDENNFN